MKAEKNRPPTGAKSQWGKGKEMGKTVEEI
jgi:hypothetical protein